MKFHVWAASAALIMIVFGLVYHVEAYKVDERLGRMQPLRRPLDEIPLHFGSWRGEAHKLPAHIEKVAGADEYILRIYKDTRTGRSLQFYLTYNGRPRTVLGHRPDICFPSQGWKKVLMQPRTITLSDGTTIPVTVHYYRRDGFNQIVINYFNISGLIGNDPAVAVKMGHRSLSRKHFNAQVILYMPASDAQTALKQAASFLDHVHPEIIKSLPDTSDAAAR